MKSYGNCAVFFLTELESSALCPPMCRDLAAPYGSPLLTTAEGRSNSAEKFVGRQQGVLIVPCFVVHWTTFADAANCRARARRRIPFRDAGA